MICISILFSCPPKVVASNVEGKTSLPKMKAYAETGVVLVLTTQYVDGNRATRRQNSAPVCTHDSTTGLTKKGSSPPVAEMELYLKSIRIIAFSILSTQMAAPLLHFINYLAWRASRVK